MTDRNGTFVWTELLTDDVDRGVGFYADLLDLQPSTMDMGDFEYRMLGRGEQGDMGIVAPQTDRGPSHWTNYLHVEDVDAAAAKVEPAGGKVIVPPTDLPGVGRFSLVADPSGATVNLFTSANDMQSDGSDGPVHWTELQTPEPAKVVDFYREVAGVEASEMPMPDGPYTILARGEKQMGGIAKVPAEAGSHWLPYFKVEDLDAALGKAEKGGAGIQMPALEVEGVGRFAIIRDAGGAAAGLIKPAS